MVVRCGCDPLPRVGVRQAVPGPHNGGMASMARSCGVTLQARSAARAEAVPVVCHDSPARCPAPRARPQPASSSAATCRHVGAQRRAARCSTVHVAGADVDEGRALGLHHAARAARGGGGQQPSSRAAHARVAVWFVCTRTACANRWRVCQWAWHWVRGWPPVWRVELPGGGFTAHVSRRSD